MTTEKDPRREKIKQKVSNLRRKLREYFYDHETTDSFLQSLLQGNKLSEDDMSEDREVAHDLADAILALCRVEPAIDIAAEVRAADEAICARLAAARTALDEACELAQEHDIPFRFSAGVVGNFDPGDGWSQSRLC